MIVKAHATEDKRLLLAICDTKLIGKKFEEGNKQLDLTSEFYNGQEKSEQETINLMKKAYILNLVGENVVNLALKLELISGDHVDHISKIPYAQCLMG
jgi:hypothetical protein|tara:strand:- start:515 stop:808 length:294 start_codon:yes stop_codon:yes gene_type:complete